MSLNDRSEIYASGALASHCLQYCGVRALRQPCVLAGINCEDSDPPIFVMVHTPTIYLWQGRRAHAWMRFFKQFGSNLCAALVKLFRREIVSPRVNRDDQLVLGECVRKLRKQFVLKPGDRGHASLEARHYASQRPAIFRHLNECILIAHRGLIAPQSPLCRLRQPFRAGNRNSIRGVAALASSFGASQASLSRARRSAHELVGLKLQLKQICDPRRSIRRLVRTRNREIAGGDQIIRDLDPHESMRVVHVIF